MSATATIARLRAEVQKLRADNPDLAALYDEREMLQKALAEYERLTKTVTGMFERIAGGDFTAPGFQGGFTLNEIEKKREPKGQHDLTAGIQKKKAQLAAEDAANSLTAQQERREQFAKARDARERSGRVTRGVK